MLFFIVETQDLSKIFCYIPTHNAAHYPNPYTIDIPFVHIQYHCA